jgi:hypothetical protein
MLSDPAPDRALTTDMAFGPGSAIVRNWLDDIFVSPWVSLASTPTATGTALQYRMFDGQKFSRGKIVQQWRVRSHLRIDNTIRPAPGDSIDCYTPWVGEDLLAARRLPVGSPPVRSHDRRRALGA